MTTSPAIIRVVEPSGREAFRQDAIRAWGEYQATGLHLTSEEADIDSLSQRIDGDELLAQRRDFRAAGYLAPVSKVRRSPFR